VLRQDDNRSVGDKAKPAGVVLIAVCSGLFGLGMVPVGCAAASLGAFPGGTMISFAGVLISALGVFLIASAYGLWTLQPWGRAYAWWLYLGCIPLGVLAIFPLLPGQTMSVGNTVMQLIGIAIDIAVLIYLARPEVARLFEAAAAEQQAFDQFVRREPR
jgi:uncharacterized membrane protein (DUF2068 family)